MVWSAKPTTIISAFLRDSISSVDAVDYFLFSPQRIDIMKGVTGVFGILVISNLSLSAPNEGIFIVKSITRLHPEFPPKVSN